MVESPRTRAAEYLKICAAQIAPLWLEHYADQMPPKEITDFFDQAVANIIAAESELAFEFGHHRAQRSALANDLLDIVIHQSHREVQRLRAETRRTENEARWQDEVGAPQTATERLAYLRSRRDARGAECAEAEAHAKAEAQALQAQLLRLMGNRIDRLYGAEKRSWAYQTEKLQKVAAAWPELGLLEQVAKAVVSFMQEASGDKEPNEILDGLIGYYIYKPEPEKFPSAFDVRIERAARAALEQSSVDPEERDRLGWYQELFTDAIIRFFSAVGSEFGANKLPLQLRTVCRAVLQGFAQVANTADTKGPMADTLRQVSQQNWFASSQNVIFGPYWERRFDFTRRDVRQLEPFPYTIIIDAIYAEVSAAVDERDRQIAAHRTLVAAARKDLDKWQEMYPHPGAQPYGVSPNGAEHWVKNWCLHMGLEGAAVTRQSGDGGIDVLSPTHIVQVKHYTGTVGIAAIRELIGVASVDGRKAALFTSGTFPPSASEMANRAEVGLFVYDVFTGEVQAASSAAAHVMKFGLLPQEQ